MKKTYLYITVICFIIVVILVYIKNKNVKVSTTPIAPVIVEYSPATMTSEWKTYSDKKVGLEFKYPPEFEADIDSVSNSIHLVNKNDCKHDAPAEIRNKKFCYNFTFTTQKTEFINNISDTESVGIDKIPGFIYERWSSGGTITHNTAVKKDDSWYVFGYYYNNKDQTEAGTLQDVKDNYYSILSTVIFNK